VHNGTSTQYNPMFLCKYFVFLHPVKTGGTFVNRVLTQYIPSNWDVQIFPGHNPVDSIPNKYKTLPIIGFVRNPWDHYVSWYEYCVSFAKNNSGHFPPDHPFASVSDQGRNDFATTTANIMSRADKAKTGLGGVTWYYSHMFGTSCDNLKDYSGSERKIGKFENLRNDLVALLNETGMPKLPRLEEAILTDPPINSLARPPYQSYYDTALRNIVEERDKLIIEEFNYSFD